MPAITFGDVWRKVRLHAPSAGFGLAREWTQWAYEQVCDRRPWMWSMETATLEIQDARSIAVGVTQNSATVTSAALFVAGDAGRQFRVGTIPTYTIQTVVDASTATLDQVYGGTTAAATTGQILDQFATMPANFGAFLLITDVQYQRLVPYWYTQEDLGRIDPIRQSSDASPRALVPRGLSSYTPTLGQLSYEWWPAPTSAKSVPYWYRKAPEQMTDTDILRGVLANRSTLLQTGALAKCAAWPGTTEQKNPYFNLALHKQYLDEFEHGMALLELRDDDQQMQSWNALPYHRWAAWDLSYSTQYLRSSDATVGDYRYSA